MTRERWRRLAQEFDSRVLACSELPFQSLPTGRSELSDPLSGRRVLLNPARAGRPRMGSAADAYREGRTPPTLSFVREAGPPVPEVECETDSLDLARARLAAAETADPAGGLPGRAVSPWELVESFRDDRRGRDDGARVPLVFPSVAWRARTFFNLAPIAADRASGANGFVVAVSPEHESADLGRLSSAPEPLAGGRPGDAAPAIAAAPDDSSARTPILPALVFDAVVYSWALLEQWAESRSLVPVPFINGGKGAASGQSLKCFHAQFYALGPEHVPPFHEALHRAATRGDCPLCSLVASEELQVDRVGEVGVWAHPAPETEATLTVAAVAHKAALASLDEPSDFARGIERAVRSFETLLGGVPPYNVSVRCGRHAGHLHAEVTPRAGVAVAAGFEKATGLGVSTRPPASVAAELRARPAGAGTVR